MKDVSKRWCVPVAILLCLPVFAYAQQIGPGPGAAQSAPSPNDPVLTHRPAKPAKVGPPEGRIKLDVVVTDAKGMPVSGLTQQGFTVLDDKQPRQIVSFYAFDGNAQKADPPVEVILLLDAINLSFQEVSITRQQVEKFLRQNGGHLAQPVSIFVATDQTLLSQRQPSNDGNALAARLHELGPIGQSPGMRALDVRFNLSIKMLMAIASAEMNEPGRKLLVWLGPGWPTMGGVQFSQASERVKEQDFSAIVALSTRLREAHIALYSISDGQPGEYAYAFQEFLKGVKSAREADSGDLSLKVLATESGGRVLLASNDLADQIGRCLQDAGAFYTLTFDPPHTDSPDEYHDLKVLIKKPGLTARTSSGYYDQP